MPFLALSFSLLSLGVLAADDTKPKKISFANATIGELPKGWTAAKTGKGDGSLWKIVEDKDAPGGKALMQTSDAGTGSFFNLCIAEETNYTDLDATFLFKAITGKEDQGGGLIWRCKDANSYYIARFNPLEDNFRLYTVTNGKRSKPLADVKLSLPAGTWHTMRIVHQGDHIQCYLNGKLHIDVKDSTYPEGGKIGFWSKADAQTRFAELQISGK
jgi:hypothetical protein